VIYVTNGGGYVSREIVNQLVRAGLKVRFLVARAEDGKAVEGPNTEIIVGDLLRPATFAPSLKGIDAAVLLTRNTRDQLKREVAFTAAARAAGIARIVKISAFGANINEEPGALRVHGLAEAAIARTGIAWTFLRPQFFMQNILWFTKEIKNTGTFTLPMKTGRIGMIDFRDIAAVAVKCAADSLHAGKIYNLSGPELLSMQDVAEKLSRAVGTPIRYNDVSGEEFRQLLISMGRPAWRAKAVSRLYVGMSRGTSAALSQDVQNILGRTATPFDQVASDYAHHFRAA
jgi:uncharacterized protein YbjT (DUF2867 family)